MKIRAITLGIPLDHSENSKIRLKKQLDLIRELRTKFTEQNVDVQTVRFCTQPYTAKSDFPEEFFDQIPQTLDFIDSLVHNNLVDYYSYLPGLCDQSQKLNPTQLNCIKKLPEYIEKHPVMFSSVQVSSVFQGISFQAIRLCSDLIKTLAEQKPFNNLQFAVTFNVPPNTPFFPSAYHEGKVPRLSIALEAADEVVRITQKFSDSKWKLRKLQEEITNRFTKIYDEIYDIVSPFCTKYGIIYSGMDFSPSQYPEQDKSIGTAVENIKLSHFGEVGSVFAIGFLTLTLQNIKRPKIGFSGFMQPLLEDYMIAKRHDERKFGLSQLLLNSTVCGLGLDCIPLPGDVSEQTLTLLMMDVAMLSTRLNKPLTCRLMPIPNKSSEERTEFDFEYFTNSKICELHPSSQSQNLETFIKQNPGFLF